MRINEHARKLFLWLLCAFVFAATAPGSAPINHKHPEAGKHSSEKPAKQDQNYIYEEIRIPQVPEGTILNITPWDINNRGVVSGTYQFELGTMYKTYTFTWYKREWTKVAYIDPRTLVEADFTSVPALTESEVLFGNWGSFNEQHAGFYDPKRDGWVALPDYPDPARPIKFGGRVNNAGVAVGGACNSDWIDCVGWVWDGKYHAFTVPAYQAGTSPQGINERGDIVVQSDAEPVVTPFNPLKSYLGNRRDLVFSPISPSTQDAGVYDINNRDEMVMMAPLDDPAGFYVPLLYNYKQQTLTRLPRAPEPFCAGGENAWYTGMNDSGDLVGVCWDAGGTGHAFVAHKK